MRYDELGNNQLQMMAENLNLGGFPRDCIGLFLMGRKLLEDPQGSYITEGFGSQNRCARMSVENDEGAFSGNVEPLPSVVDDGERAFLTFSTSDGEYDSKRASVPQYYLIPLVNFVSEFPEQEINRTRSRQVVHNQPSAGGPTPSLFDLNSIADRAMKREIIAFDFRGSPGLIEPLPDFDKRVVALREGKTKSLVTAIMVGQLPEDLRVGNAARQWFPRTFLRLLSLSTGVKVGSAWIEFWDANQNVVRRVHRRQEISPFCEGRAAILQRLHGGIGHVLSHAASSKWFDSPYILPALKYAFNCGFTDQTSIEDRLVAGFRGIGCLLDMYRSELPRAAGSLPAERRQEVDRILRSAASQIKSLQESASLAEKDDLVQIEGKVKAASSLGGFGRDLRALLGYLQLPDAEILDEYFGSHPKARWRDATDFFGRYRGKVMHRGWLNLGNDEGRISEALAVANHLNDLLLRMLFKTIGYDGTYEAAVFTCRNMSPISWVTQHTSATTLGYNL